MMADIQSQYLLRRKCSCLPSSHSPLSADRSTENCFVSQKQKRSVRGWSLLPHIHRNERHRVISENVDNLHRDCVATWPVVGVDSCR